MSERKPLPGHKLDFSCHSFFRRGGVYPHKRSNKKIYIIGSNPSNCNCLLRAFSINRFLIRDQLSNACGIEILGTIALWITINQNSNSLQGLLTGLFLFWFEWRAGGFHWISPGGKKFCLLVHTFNQQGYKHLPH